jgi:hypothetical protein
MLPGRPASLRIYGHEVAGRRSVVITLASSSLALRPADFEVIAGDETVRGTVDPGGARPPVEITVCVPAGGHANVWLLSRRGTRLEDGRVVSVHVDRLWVSPSWPCAAS